MQWCAGKPSHAGKGLAMHKPEEQPRLTITEAARRLGIGRNAAHEAARAGQIL
jgi:hypothetical protein